jgi:sec-independent protein translocase protein TatC
MSFMEHISELRARLRTVAIVLLVILVVLVLVPVNPVYQVQHLGQYLNLQFVQHTLISWFILRVKSDILPSNVTLIAANGIGEGMEIYFIAAFLATVALGMPVIAYETYKFVDPALKENERKLIYPFVTATTALFTVGILFGYFILARFLVIALVPFLNATGTSLSIDAASFYYVIFLIIGATGVSFTTPVFVYSLISLRILDADFFSRNRVVVWFLVWVVAGLFLTPDGGPLLDLVIFIPLVAMLELAVFLGKRKVRGRPEVIASNECRYCSTKLVKGQPFCPSCGRYNSVAA